jgi:glycosyltransferase involved in cell wall biosynthesis
LKELIELNINLTKVIYVIHHLHSNKIEEFEHEINRPEINIVVSSSFTARECKQMGINNFKVSKLGVDTSLFKPKVLQNKRTVILKIGFFYYSNSRKNPSLIENIILKLIDSNSKIHINIFGNGFKRKHDRIFIHENLSEKKYAHELSQLDLFIYISKLEGFGLPPLEAMASGVPVISSNVGAVAEYMDHGEDGYIVNVDAGINEWINKIEYLISNNDLRNKFSANGVKKAKNWTWDRTFKVYRELIE